jgi:protein-L-isoaspartate(D-aspartate) O-methyltransferase
MDPVEAHRTWYARLVTATAGIPPSERRLLDAFASTPRERFVGAGPWQVFTRIGYVETPSDDPTFLYQDVAVALVKDRQVNNGQPSLHAVCLAALGVREREAVVHVGAGTGYYSAILARLAGSAGSVDAYEIDPVLAARAAENLADHLNVRVHAASGTEGALPACDALYVNAGATGPAEAWLDALRPGGRLLFPLTALQGAGAMLLATRTAGAAFAARFVCGASFIPCAGARDEETERALAAAFQRGGMGEVKSLRRGGEPDATAWCAGRGWWLSTAPPGSSPRRFEVRETSGPKERHAT